MNGGLHQLSANIDPHQAYLINIANAISSSLSILGSLFNLVTTIILRKEWTTIGKMIVALSLADILGAAMTIFLFIQNPSNLTCQTISFFSTFGNISSFLWTCFFAHAMYVSMNHIEVRSLSKYWWRYVAISFILSAGLGITAVYTSFYTVGVDPAPEYCYHRSLDERFDWGNLIIIILPMGLSALYCSFCYISVVGQIRKTGSNLFSEVVFFPLILIICNLPICIVGFLTEMKGSWAISFSFVMVANILWNIQGLFNAFAYGLSQKIIYGYKELCCMRKREHTISLLKSANQVGGEPSSTSYAAMTSLSEETEKSVV